MAKKGAVQQLQAELNSDEDFEKFMERDGLLVLDVYTEWCGPCVGMIGSLKKIKLELGGDNLHLAICKADTVNYMERFRNKSEPTWLFASHNKIVNCLFGTNVPELMQVIADELQFEAKYNAGEYQRKFYEWTELTPVEQARENKRKAREEEINRKEHQAEQKRRAEYLTFVTNEIIERLPDAGVTFIMPNYAKERDIQKKLGEPADKCGLNMKDRRIITLKESDLEVILFDVTNPMHSEIYKKLFTEEILAVYWKTHDTELRDVLDLLNNYVDILCNPQPLINEDGQPDPELKMPPIFKPWKFDVPQDIYKQILHDMGISEEEEKHREHPEVEVDAAPLLEGAAATIASPTTAVEAEASRPPTEPEPSPPGSAKSKTTADAATGAPESPSSRENDETPRTDDSANTTARSDDTAGTTSGTTDTADSTPRTDESTDASPRSDESTDKSTPDTSTDPSPRSDNTAKSEQTTGTQSNVEGGAKSPATQSPEKSPVQSKPPTPQSATEEPGGEAAVAQPLQEIATEAVKSDSKASVVTFEKENDGMVTLNVPAIYAAGNKRGNASLIYLYFRHLTDHFLPPDPVPEPPHVAVIFDAIKRKDVCQLMANLPDAVLAYGYFSGTDPDTAHLLAKTHDLYGERKFNIEDKLVLKVAKKTSNMLLTFVGLGPTFVSFSTEEGKDECKKFFPFGYNEEDEDETSSVDSSSSKKKRKKKKKKEGSGSDIGISEPIAEETEEGIDEGDNLPDDDEGGLVEEAEPGAPEATPPDTAAAPVAEPEVAAESATAAPATPEAAVPPAAEEAKPAE